MLRVMQNNRTREPLTFAQRAICVAAFSTLLAACATRLDNAPVVDRSGSLGTTAATQPAVPLGPPPPGFYRVKPGDTLYRSRSRTGRTIATSPRGTTSRTRTRSKSTSCCASPRRAAQRRPARRSPHRSAARP
jgi:hypothetical protein